MAYCTNCGQPLLGQVKFCAGCGTKVVSELIQTYAAGYKEKMYKGVEQQLKSSLRSYAESTLRKNISRMAEKGISAVLDPPPIPGPTPVSQIPVSQPSPAEKKSTTVSQPTVTEPPIEYEVNGGITIWTWLYVIVNVIIAVRGYLSNEVIGILVCSIIVLLLVFTRRKKVKPYNWLSKLLIVVQMVVVASILYRHVMGQFFTFTSLLFAALLYIGFSLLFKGNKQIK